MVLPQPKLFAVQLRLQISSLVLFLDLTWQIVVYYELSYPALSDFVLVNFVAEVADWLIQHRLFINVVSKVIIRVVFVDGVMNAIGSVRLQPLPWSDLEKLWTVCF